MTQRVPRLLDHRYELNDIIGSGGMATVYSARDTRLGREVAIKILRPEQAKDPVFRARFQREAEAVASLNHPSVVSVYDTGTFRALDEQELADADPEATAPMPAMDADRRVGEQPVPGTEAAGAGEAVPYIVMEMLRGRTLKSLLENGPLPIPDAEGYARDILDALQYSHDRGIIHRDVKPANVMVMDRTEEDDSTGRRSRIKVMDFGIARAMTETATPLTEAQTIMGTARYIAPEQARGETVDARSDLYSVGCILFQMLAGRPPFEGKTSVEVAGQHLRETPQPPSTFRPEVSPALDAVVLRALEKNRADRFQTAEEFSYAIENASHGITTSSSDDDPTEAIHPGSAAALGAGAAGLAAGGAAGATAWDDREEDPEDAAYTTETGHQPQLEDASVAGFFPDAQEEYSDEELYDSERDEALAAKRRRRTAWKNTILALVIILLAATAGSAWLYYQHELNKPVYVSVPEVHGADQQKAEDDLRNAGLKVTTQEDYSDKVADGQAIETDPEESTRVEKDSTVTLHVSKGPKSLTIPDDFKGQSEAYVRSELDKMGLKAGKVETVNDPKVGAGMVVNTSPQTGSHVDAGSTVNLVLSTGKVTVPSVVGMQKDQAVSTMIGKNTLLSTQTVEEESDEPEGTVIEQSASAGTSIEQGSTVTLTVSKGRPTESASPEPSEPSSEPTDDGGDDGNDDSSSPSPSESSAEPQPSESSSEASPSPSHTSGGHTERGIHTGN